MTNEEIKELLISYEMGIHYTTSTERTNEYRSFAEKKVEKFLSKPRITRLLNRGY